MVGIRLCRSSAVLACAVLAFALGGCAPLRTRQPPLSGAPGVIAGAAGAATFDKWCSDCHRTAGGPGSIALQRKYRGALPAVLEQRSDLVPEYVALVVRRGVSFMPSFRKTEISDAELALVASYLVKRP
jgi:mono/diheme cytochrome c family protein